MLLTSTLAGAMLLWTVPARPALALARVATGQMPTKARASASKGAEPQSNREAGAQSSGVQPRFSPGTQAILKMVKHNVEPEVILAFIRSSPVEYHLSADEIIALQHDGVPGSVLAAMLQHGASLRAKESESAQSPTPPAVAPPSQPAPSVPAPAYSYVYPPYTSGYFGYGSPYGASVTYNNSYPTYINGYPVYSYGYYGVPYSYYPYYYPYYYSYYYPFYYGLNSFSFYPFGFFGGRFHYGFDHRFGHFDRDFDHRGIFPGRGVRPGFGGFNRAFGLHAYHGTVPFRGRPGGFVSGFGARHPGGFSAVRGGAAFGGFRGGGFHGGGFHGRR